jgi:hypothetical protein
MPRPKPHYGSINHPSTVVVATTKPELAYILEWCRSESKHVADFLEDFATLDFPFCVAVKGDVVGWTTSMDRVLYYMPFQVFTSSI